MLRSLKLRILLDTDVRNGVILVSSPDVEFCYRGKTILIEIKAWHFNVDTNNINKFKGYLSRPQYAAGIIVNFDTGKFILDGEEIEGIQIYDGKIAYYLTSPGFNLQSLRSVLEVLSS